MASDTLDIDELLKIYGASPGYRPQFEHRVRIVKSWNILPGSRVLEIGPGQGDCTVVLATAVGESGHVDAVDPAPLSYGTPYLFPFPSLVDSLPPLAISHLPAPGSPVTIGQSQAQLSTSYLGPRISWIEDSPEHYLSTINSSQNPYTHIILLHSLWYFSSPSTFPSLLRLLPAHTTPNASLCIAEYALHTPSLASVPHVLAAITSATLQAEEQGEERNVRNISGPDFIKDAAGTEGWFLKEEEVMVPPKGLQDGRWEVSNILSENFEKEVQEVLKRHEGMGGILRSMREAVMGSLEVVEGGVQGVETMGVWVGRLEKGSRL